MSMLDGIEKCGWLRHGGTVAEGNGIAKQGLRAVQEAFMRC